MNTMKKQYLGASWTKNEEYEEYLNIMIYIYFIFSQLYLIYSCGMGMVSFFSGSLQYHKRLNIYRDETVKQKFSNMEDSAIWICKFIHQRKTQNEQYQDIFIFTRKNGIVKRK